MDKVTVPEGDQRLASNGPNEPLAREFTFYVVVTNRAIFLEECVETFRKCYPSIKGVLIDNSGSGQYRELGEKLGLAIQSNDRVMSVSENQNWMLDHSPTKYFVFTADDIVFTRQGFLEEALVWHQKGFELVSFGVDDPCAFSMQAGKDPKIGRFNTRLGGKELTDFDIKQRSENVYGFLPSVGGYWRKTPLWWESKYITHRHDKPDVNQFLIEHGISADKIHNERATHRYKRVLKMLYERAAILAGASLFKYESLLFRKGLHPGAFEVRNRLHGIPWHTQRMLSIGQVPRHYFWPYNLARLLGANRSVEKVIIEKCEAYQPFLEKRFTAAKNFRVVSDDVLNVEKFFEPKSFDLSVWYDGPEHLQKDDAVEAIKRIERVTRGLVFIGTPLGFHRQGADSFNNIHNAYNAHLSGWETSELKNMGYETHVCKGTIPSFVAWKYLE